MRFLKFLIICVVVFSLIGFMSVNSNAQWWLTASSFGLTSIGPTWFQTGIGVPIWASTGVGGPFWASSILDLLPTSPVAGTFVTPTMLAPAPSAAPGIGVAGAPPIMVAPTPSVAPGIGGGAAFTPLMLAAASIGGGGGLGFWPTAIMFPSAPAPVPAGGTATPIMLAPTPAFAPGIGGGGIAATPLMVAPTLIGGGGGGGGLGFWPTAIMFPGAPVPAAGAAFPAVMPPII